MKVEETLYSNIAKLIAGNIQRNHKIEFGALNIFAQEPTFRHRARPRAASRWLC